jgi:hypothetical protein
MSEKKSAPAFFLSITCSFLCGCATLTALVTPSPLGDNEAMIAPNVVFVIPPPADLGQTATVAQTIVAHYRDQSYAFEAQIQIAPKHLELAALDGLGRRALTISWKSGGIEHKQASWLPPFIRPADILADVAIVYWPEKIVASSLAQSGATLSVGNGSRRISMGGREIMVVEYDKGQGWNRNAKLHSLAFGYEIDIQSSEIAP